jgi:hypothetical protein
MPYAYTPSACLHHRHIHISTPRMCVCHLPSAPPPRLTCTGTRTACLWCSAQGSSDCSRAMKWGESGPSSSSTNIPRMITDTVTCKIGCGRCGAAEQEMRELLLLLLCHTASPCYHSRWTDTLTPACALHAAPGSPHIHSLPGNLEMVCTVVDVAARVECRQ